MTIEESLQYRDHQWIQQLTARRIQNKTIRPVRIYLLTIRSWKMKTSSILVANIHKKSLAARSVRLAISTQERACSMKGISSQ